MKDNPYTKAESKADFFLTSTNKDATAKKKENTKLLKDNAILSAKVKLEKRKIKNDKGEDDEREVAVLKIKFSKWLDEENIRMEVYNGKEPTRNGDTDAVLSRVIDAKIEKEGYFYADDGSYIGQGKDKSNVEVHKAVEYKKNKDGSYMFTKSQKVYDDHEEFKTFAGSLYQEVGSSEYEEAAAMYDVLENRTNLTNKYKGTNIRSYDILIDSKQGINGYKNIYSNPVEGANQVKSLVDNSAFIKLNSGHYDKNKKSKEYISHGINKMNSVRKGLINAMLNTETDYSSGATSWDGNSDFITTSRYTKGYCWTSLADRQLAEKIVGQVLPNASNKEWAYKSTTVLGKTIFSIITEKFLIKEYGTNYKEKIKNGKINPRNYF